MVLGPPALRGGSQSPFHCHCTYHERLQPAQDEEAEAGSGDGDIQPLEARQKPEWQDKN